MSEKVKLPLWERRFGRVLLAWWIMVMLLITVHIWQESMGEDGAMIWSCRTMGERHCGPGQPWIDIRWPQGWK